MTLFLITAPSGAGKTTIAQAIQHQRTWKECISHTTRPMRNGEVDGETYHFVTVNEFKAMNEKNEFAETVLYDDNYYGITKEEIKIKSVNSHAFIIVDYCGYQQTKEIYPDAVGIFLHMSKEDCMANMLLRGDKIEDALKRVARYEDEMKNRIHFDYVIKNVRNKEGATQTILKNIIHQNANVLNREHSSL